VAGRASAAGPVPPDVLAQPVAGAWLTATLGLVLLIGLTIMIVTGLLSYAAYDPSLPGNDTTPGKGLLGTGPDPVRGEILAGLVTRRRPGHRPGRADPAVVPPRANRAVQGALALGVDTAVPPPPPKVTGGESVSAATPSHPHGPDGLFAHLIGGSRETAATARR